MDNPLVNWLNQIGWEGTDVPSLHAAKFNRMVKSKFNMLYNIAYVHRSKCSVLCRSVYGNNNRWLVYATAKEYPIVEVAEYKQSPTQAKLLADITLHLSLKYPDLLELNKETT